MLQHAVRILFYTAACWITNPNICIRLPMMIASFLIMAAGWQCIRWKSCRIGVYIWKGVHMTSGWKILSLPTQNYLTLSVLSCASVVHWATATLKGIALLHGIIAD